MDFRDKARGWIDDARYEIKKFFKRKVKKEEKMKISTKLDGCGIIPLLS